jgi:hypothetical protein
MSGVHAAVRSFDKFSPHIETLTLTFWAIRWPVDELRRAFYSLVKRSHGPLIARVIPGLWMLTKRVD